MLLPPIEPARKSVEPEIVLPAKPARQATVTPKRGLRTMTLLLAGGVIGGAGHVYYTSHQRWLLHTAPVHADASVIEIAPPRRTGEYDVALAFKDEGGHVRQVLAKEGEAAAFANTTLAFIQTEEAKVRAELQRDIAALVEAAFADRERSIEELADWNFAYGRSWRILIEGAVAAITHIPKALVSKETIHEAVRHEVEAYFLRHYKQFVLKPEIRDAVLVRGLEAALLRAHASYVRIVANVDLRLQLFLARNTELLDSAKTAHVRTLKLDWDAQAFKAPRYGLEDHAMSAVYRGAQVAGLSALVAHTVGPAIETQLIAIFSAVAGRVMAALAPELTAAITGTTLGGPWAGYAAGLIVGIGADWFVTKETETSRPASKEIAPVLASLTNWPAPSVKRAPVLISSAMSCACIVAPGTPTMPI